MVNTTVALLLLVVFSFLISATLKKTKSNLISVSGLLYILLGAVIGPKVGFHLINVETLSQFQPFLSLLIGLVGFVLGLHIRDTLKSREVFWAGVSASLVVLLVVSVLMGAMTLFILSSEVGHGVVLWSFEWVWPWQEVSRFEFCDTHLWIALTLGAGAASASTILLNNAQSLYRNSGPVTERLQLLARVFQMVAVLVFGFALSSSRAVETAGSMGITVSEWALTAIAAGVSCGFLFSLFIGRESQEDRLYLASFGGVVFASGVGTALGISPLFVNFIFGATLGLASQYAVDIRPALDRIAEPIFVMLLIFAGAHWEPVSGLEWVFPSAYFAIRYWAMKQVTPSIFRQLAGTHGERGPNLGAGLMGQDLMAIAIGLSFLERFPAGGNLVLSAVLGGVLLNQLLGYVELRRLLLDAGEIQVKIDLPAQTEGDS
ncbi:MAG: hypothetical protein H6624_05255 [Bdellovibrionaceae bacterium]|nr:hypothetical protein [Pseudobdellovibrionaceae bacterium]